MTRSVTPWILLATVVGFVLGLSAVLVPALPTSQIPVALALLVLPFLLMIVRHGERFLLGAILFETSIPLDVFLGFREDAAALSALPGLPISLTTILLGLLYATWTLRRLAGRTPSDPGALRAAAPLGVYVAVVASSAVGAVDPQLASFEVGLLLQLLLLFVYLVHAVRTVADLRFMVRLLVAMLFVQGLIMSYLVATGQSVEVGPFLARIDEAARMRVAGTVGSPNAAGAFLILLLLPTLAVWRTAATAVGRAVAAGVFGLGAVMLVLTLSRGAWLGFGVAMLVFLLGGLGLGRLRKRFVTAVVAFGAVVAAALAGPILARLFGAEASPVEHRVRLMQMAMEMFRDHPWRGVGANGFSAALPDYLGPEFAGAFVSVVHNKYLIVASETGIVGLIAFMGFVVVTWVRGWQAARTGSTPVDVLALGLTAAFTGVLVHMLLDLFHGRTDTQMVIVIAALMTAAWRLARRRDANEAPGRAT